MNSEKHKKKDKLGTVDDYNADPDPAFYSKADPAFYLPVDPDSDLNFAIKQKGLFYLIMRSECWGSGSGSAYFWASKIRIH